MFVKLSAGDVWSYKPPINNKVAWSFFQSGTMRVNGENVSKELVVFEESLGELGFEAVTNCAFLFGTAVKHDYDLVLGSHSVHTSIDALNQGQTRINQIGEQLHRERKLI